MKAADGMENRIVKAFGMSDCMYYKQYELVFPLIFYFSFLYFVAIFAICSDSEYESDNI